VCCIDTAVAECVSVAESIANTLTVAECVTVAESIANTLTVGGT